MRREFAPYIGLVWGKKLDRWTRPRRRRTYRR
nr:copper resistance protein B [Burkholderia sp. LMG 13014]